MARFDIDCPNDILKDLESLYDDVADEMIDAALPIYQKEIQKQLEPHRDTGELIEGIKIKKSQITENDAHIGYITVEGVSSKSTYTRKNGKSEPYRNFQKFMGLEYGVDGQQPATPFMQTAKNNAEPAMRKAMQGILDERKK